MTRWEGGRCPKCGRPIAQKVGEPARPCPDCTAVHETDDTVTRMLCLRNDELQAEVDALVALVERLREAFMPGDGGTDGGRLLAIGYVLNSAPTTSFAHQKLLWQAEVLEEAGRFVRCEEDAALLRINAAELRRQAKEDPQ